MVEINFVPTRSSIYTIIHFFIDMSWKEFHYSLTNSFFNGALGYTLGYIGTSLNIIFT